MKLHTTFRSIITVALLTVSVVSTAQLTVSPQTNLQQLAADISGSGVTISNPVINCHALGYGTFTYSGTQLGADEGVLLTTGRITDAPGPNNNTGNSNWFGQGTAGDPVLNAVTGRTTMDACKFEFDIIPVGDSLTFNFTFASEEYNEWVGSQYNDVFGFFISGPGIVGDPNAGNAKNIALIPGTNQAVTINNVNNGSNSAYFQNNAGGSHIQYDGFTRNLVARTSVTACSSYHLTLVIADATDRKFDSGVFIEKIKSHSVTMQPFTASGSTHMVEGCNPGFVRFSRAFPSPTPLSVSYFIHGTATNGSDYSPIAPTNPALAKTIVIPANQTYVDRPVNPIGDGINEGSEHLTFILGNPFCPAQTLDTLEFVIADTLIAAMTPGHRTICAGDSVQYTITGGTSYSWSPTTGVSDPTSASTWVHPSNTTTYAISVVDGTCTRTILRTVRVSHLALTGAVTPPLCNTSTNGAINLSLNGGIAPYGFMWSGPNGFTASTEDISGLAPGTYSVTVTDAGCTRTASFNVVAPAALSVGITPSIMPFGQNIACNGGSTGSIATVIAGGSPAYAVNWSGPGGFSSTSANIGGLAAGNYAITVTDVNGCTATANTTLVQPTAMTATITGTTPVICSGSTFGQATVGITGGIPPYAYAWGTSPVQSTATATGLTAGTYPVTVTDGYGCTATATAVIGGPTNALSAALSARTNVLCHGNSTGSATITTTGGTAPRTVTWNTSPVQNGATATGLPAGTWTATVTDANNCSITFDVVITEPATALSANLFAQTAVACFGTTTGSATISASGGSGPYTYQWNTTPAQNTATATGLAAGTYSCTVRDVNNCQATSTATITGPGAALSASVTSVTNVLIFGQSTGAATIAISGGTAPYQTAWSTNPVQTGTTITGLGAGTYVASITDALGCTTTVSVTITQPGSALSVAITAQSDPACHGELTGTVTAQGTGAVPPYTYSWNTTPPQNSATATGLGAGPWSVTVTDANGAMSTAGVIIGGPTAPLALTVAQALDQTCFGNATGQATVFASGGTAPYSYSWNTFPVQTSATAVGLTNGTYQATVTDALGCTAQVQVTINGPAAPLTIATASVTPVLCTGESTGGASVIANGGTAPYTHVWYTTPQVNGNALTNVPAGSYTAVVTDANGCIASTNVNVPEPPVPFSAYVESYANVSCFGLTDGWAQIEAVGGSGSYTITWNTVPPQNGPLATGLGSGTWTVTVTDNNGCTIAKSYPVTIGGPTAPVMVSALVSDHNGLAISCPGGEDGSIDITITGGTAPYFHTWTDDFGGVSGSEDLNNLSAGTYHLTVSDANGCTVQQDLTLTGPTAITATATITTATCMGAPTGAIDASVSGGTAPYLITWSGPNGFTASGEDITALHSGVYTMHITDAHGCTSLALFNVNEPGLLTITGTMSTYVGGSNVSCHAASDGAIDITAVGGTQPYTYLWNGPSGYTGSTEDISALGAGAYTATVIDANGCASLASFQLIAPAPLVIALQNSAYNGADLSCANAVDGAVSATVTGGTPALSFAWTGPGGFAAGTEDISGLGAGTYTLVATDANGCQATGTTTLVAPQPLAAIATSATYNSGSNVSCDGATDGSITLSITGGTGPMNVVWSGPNGFTSTDASPSALGPGTYNAVITDINGCTTSATVTLNAPTPTAVSGSLTVQTNGLNLSCAGGNDGAIDLAVSGGAGNVTHQWSGPAGFTANTEDIAGLAEGTYTVFTIDQNGCTATAQYQLVAPQTIQATSTNGSAACTGSNTGSVDLTVTGGTAPFTFLWVGPGAYSATTEDINGLYSGGYIATITDAMGCTSVYGTAVTEPNAYQVTATQTIYPGGFHVSCAGMADGAIDVTVTGGTAPYYYQWVGPNGFAAFTEDVSGLAAGNHILVINDQNGCGTLVNYTVTEPTPVTAGLLAQIYAGGANTGCVDSQDGQVDATISGGIQPYALSWNGPNGFTAGTEDITGLEAGTYTLSVSDATGCATTGTITLVPAEPVSSNAVAAVLGNGTNVSCANASDGSIDLTVSGGAQPYTVIWSGPSGFVSSQQDITGLAAGTYTAAITDANGCTNSATTDLTAPSPLAIGLTASLFGNGFNLPCTGSNSGTLGVNITGGIGTMSFAWSGPSGFSSNAASLTGLYAGTYTLTATDANGCTATASFTLLQPSDMTLTSALSDAGSGYAVSCAGNDGAIDVEVLGGTAPFVFDWTGSNGFASLSQDLSGLAAGTYGLNVIDANGCTLGQTFVLDQPATLQAAAAVTGTVCDNAVDGAIDLTVNGGVAPYSFAWSGPNGFTANTEDLANLPGGTYSAVVTDAMNCIATISDTVHTSSGIDLVVYTSQYGLVSIPCQGDSSGVIELTITGGAGSLALDWTGPNGFTSTDATLQGLVAGLYTATITDVNGCTADTTIALTEPGVALSIALNALLYPSGTNVSCTGASDGAIDASITGGTGPYVIEWRGPDSTSYSTEDITGLVAGTYELLVTDINQCSQTVAITLAEPDSALLLDVTLSSYGGGYATSCSGSSDATIAASVSGGNGAWTLTWSGPNGFTATSDSLQGLAAGTYIATVNDLNGCALTDTITVLAPDPLVAQITPTLYPGGSMISCAGANDGSLTLTPLGGVAGYTVQWTGPNGTTASGNAISGLEPGTWCATVTDSNGCNAQSCFDLIAPEPLQLTATTVNAACGANNGSIDLEVTGGSGPYAYVWSGGSTSQDLAGMTAGAHTVTVTDANGCATDTSLTITGTNSLIGELQATMSLCANANDGSADVTLFNGTAPYTYAWSNGSTTEDLNGLAAGTYAVIVSDATGCSWSDSITITAPAPITVNGEPYTFANGANVTANGASDGHIALSVSGGVPPYSYAWSTGATTAQVNGLAAGTYTVIVTDANGCSMQLSFTLEEPDDVAMPTGFSPNGDGANDTYVIHGIETYPNNQFVVFNRWGNVVYEQLNYRNNWSGENSEGERLPDGTYFIILRLNEGAMTLQNYVDLRR